ncbi:hypothetical protein BpHYR1_007502 [Brachionus plicatilis]|uniref:Uncharacterized protein n=1 Tax=Brachionus plicatilis TaxID=10195 RepID=A0A3M7RFG6_BRAPC|nr:hypothetical protein BpHYR1_007502 [Brachionus plicatilis]
MKKILLEVQIKFLCFFAICNFTPLKFFINSSHKSHGTGFACLLSAVFTTFKRMREKLKQFEEGDSIKDQLYYNTMLDTRNYLRRNRRNLICDHELSSKSNLLLNPNQLKRV